jgi:4-diphosphocytidyl-2-C-methyl-D-erythritol kinase
MIVFPNAKINLGLNIVARRPDGYHNIQSCFIPCKWLDVLEAVESADFSFSSSGLPMAGNPEKNLCVRAYRLLQKAYDLPAMAIHLHKNIPIGAGLGGGSADGAFMLKLLNEKFALGLTTSQLEGYAAQLGSDCPFFISNRPAYVEGTGTEFSSIKIDLDKFYIAIVYPDIHIATQEAYDLVQPKPPEQNLKQVLENVSPEQWQPLVHNDFEAVLPDAYPVIDQLKDKLLERGAFYTSMTGSGSAVFGLFKDPPGLSFNLPHHCSQLRF